MCVPDKGRIKAVFSWRNGLKPHWPFWQARSVELEKKEAKHEEEALVWREKKRPSLLLLSIHAFRSWILQILGEKRPLFIKAMSGERGNLRSNTKKSTFLNMDHLKNHVERQNLKSTYYTESAALSWRSGFKVEAGIERTWGVSISKRLVSDWKKKRGSLLNFMFDFALFKTFKFNFWSKLVKSKKTIMIFNQSLSLYLWP